ncbi:MAG: cysteine desulfurase family protein, partial [Microgenomates group bacterium]
AATTPVLPEVVEAMAPFWTEKFGNASSLHSWGREARVAVEEAREKVAGILNCEPEEIVFIGTTTTSDNLAILGVARAVQSQIGNQKDKREKLHLITSQIEHHSVLDTFKYLESQGFNVTYLPVDKYGVVNLEELEKAIRLETVLVSVMYANNEVGTIEPLSEVSAKCNPSTSPGTRVQSARFGTKIYVHTDAAAAAEYLDLDVQKLGVDLLSLGSHKFGGPKGVGILYVRKGTPISPLTFGGHHERSLWPGTEAVPLIVGMAKALEAGIKNQVLSIKRVTGLRDKLIKGVLDKIPDTVLTGHPEKRLPDIASFVFKGAEGEAILLRLDAEGIAASSGSACTSGDLKPSHVLLSMGIPAEEAHGSIRFSLGRGTTEEEIDYVLEVLPRVINDLRSLGKGI